MNLPILQLGDDRLRQLSQPVADLQSPGIQALIDQLLETVEQSSGVGIAAPQIALPYRILILASRPNPRYPTAPLMEALAVINPEVVAYRGDRVLGWEGCLSVPGRRGLVPRYPEVEIRFRDRFNLDQTLVLKDFVARIFQHEYDHLQGILFPDRVESPEDLISESAYQILMDAQLDAQLDAQGDRTPA
jgi:peptide deformylase